MKKYERLLIWGFILAAAGLIGYLSFRIIRLESEVEVSSPVPETPAVPRSLKIRLDTPEDLTDWKRHSFNGETKFEISDEPDGTRSLKAVSQGTSSAIFKTVDADLASRPFLVWQWRVARFPLGRKGQVFSAPGESDFPARISVIFKSILPLQQDIVQYVWDDRFPEGTRGENPSWKKIKIMVIQSGVPANPAEWVSEKRDIVQDYTLLFGKPPEKDIEAIGIMADSDDTRSETEAYFRNFEIQTLQAEEIPGSKARPKKRLRIRLSFAPVFKKTKEVVKTVIEIPSEKIPKAVVNTTKKVVARASAEKEDPL